MEKKYRLLKRIIKKSNLTILFLLKNSAKRWSELEKVIYKKDLHNSLRELFDLGLIQATIIHDTPTGSKAYELTSLGRKIVELIEEMEKEFEKYHSKAPPKEPDRFIGELLEEE